MNILEEIQNCSVEWKELGKCVKLSEEMGYRKKIFR